MTGPAITLFPEDDEQKAPLRTTLFPEPGERMRQSLRLGSEKSPDDAAKVLRLSRETGMAPAVIERNLPEVEKRQSTGNIDLSASPVVAEWVSEHPNHAAVAQDDLGNLSAVEGLLSFLGRDRAPTIRRGFATGKTEAKLGKAGLELQGSFGRQNEPTQKRINALKAQLAQHPEAGDWFDGLLGGSAKIIGQLAEGVPFAFKTGVAGAAAGATAGAFGGPVGSAGLGLSGFGVGFGGAMLGHMVQMEGGQAYLGLSEIRNESGQPLSEAVKQGGATAYAVLSGALEVVGANILLAPFKAAGKKWASATARDMLVRPTTRQAMAEFGQTFAKTYAGEVGVEVTQEATNILVEELSKMVSTGSFATVMNDPEQREQAVNRLTETLIEAGKGMFLLGLPGASVNLATDVVRARKASQREQVYLAMGEGVKNSKTYERLPEALQTIVDRATKDGPVENVFVDVEAFQEYFQGQNADPREVARELWGTTEEYDQAVQTGSALSIPMSRYATKLAPTDHSKFFARELRQTPDGMNAREAEAFLKEAEETAKTEPADDAMEAVTKTVAEQVTATGRFKQADAQTLATQMGAFFQTTGQRYGIDPLQLFNRYGLQVLRGEQTEVLEIPKPDEELAERVAMQSEVATEVQGASILRNAQGRLPKSLKKATDQQLADEQFRLVMSNADDSQLQVPTVNEDEGGHSNSLFRPYIGMKGGAVYASGRIASRNKSIERIEAEMQERGIDPAEAFRRSAAQEPLGESEGFDFGANVGQTFKQSSREVTQAQIAAHQRYMETVAEIRGLPEERRKALSNALKALPDILELKQGDRGRIRISEGRKVSIDLFEGADFSTLLHESFHFYTAVLEDLAVTDENAATDLKALRDWVGAKEGKPLTRAQHEQIARGGEAYLMEGIAPSIALRRAFFRFKAWLKALYLTIRSLDVQLTPEVRNVFDRMFASDAEIEAAENEAGITPIFTTAEDAGMSETEFSAYRQTIEDAHIRSTDDLRTRLIKESLREQKEWWKEARSEIRTEVESEVNEEPVYRALSILQRGELSDGTAAENPFKMSKAGIVEVRGEDFTKRLPRPYVYSREGGVHPDQAAELLGFSSGGELLQALADAPKREQVIEQQTDQRMKAKYGDMMLDGSIAEIAEASVLGEHREKVIRAELAALRKKAREVKPFVAAEKEGQRTAQRTGRQILAGVPSAEFVRNVAQNRLARLRVRDIRPHYYWVGAKRASRQAIDLVAKGDYAGAADSQQMHLLSLALYREATRIKEEVDSIVEYARKLQKPTIQARIGKAQHGYLDQINKILERFDFAPSTLRENDRRASLAQFIRSMEEQNIPVSIPEEIQNEAFRKPWAEMSYEELVGVKDTLKHLDYLSLRWNRLLKSVEKRTLEEAVESAVASIGAHASKTLQRKLESRLPQDKAGRVMQAAFGSLRKYASIIREMDGWQDNGVLWNLLVRPINGAADEMSILNQEIGQKLDALFAPYTKAERLQLARKKEHVPELQTSLTRMGKIVMALNWGTEDNRAKLQAGMELTLQRSVSQSEIEAVLDTLEQRDWEFVKGVWNTFNDYWPRFKALVEQMDGIAPEKVEGIPVITKYGEIEGMYFPIAYDDRQSKEAHRDVVAERVSQVTAGASARASTKAGARHERIAGIRRPLRFDVGVIFEKLSEVAMDLTHTEALLDVNRILGHKDFETAVMDHYGDQVYKQLLNSVRDIAVGHLPAQNTLEAGLNWVRQGATIAGLGWNLTTSLLQPFGLTQSMMRIGPKWVGRGLTHWLRDAAHMENTVKWILTKSQMMKTRVNTQTREIEEIRNRLGTARSRAGTWLDIGISKVSLDKIDLQDFEDSFFWFITRAQLIADIPTWLGAYEKALEANADDEATAIALADQAVVDSQGSGQIKDLADIQKGGPAQKLWMNFYSYFSVTWNLHVEAIGRTEKNPASIGRLGVDLLLLSVVPVVLAKYMREATRGDKDDDEAEYVELIREQLGYLFGMVPLLREIGGVVQGFHGYEGPAGSRMFSEAAKLVQQIEQGDSDRALWRSLNQTAGSLFHYPAGQVQRTVEGFMFWSENRGVNPLPLFFGPPRK